MCMDTPVTVPLVVAHLLLMWHPITRTHIILFLVLRQHPQLPRLQHPNPKSMRFKLPLPNRVKFMPNRMFLILRIRRGLASESTISFQFSNYV